MHQGKAHRTNRRRAGAAAGSRRRRRTFSLAGGSSGADYVTAAVGGTEAQFQNAYGGVHAGAPTGGAIWSLSGQPSVYVQPSSQVPLGAGSAAAAAAPVSAAAKPMSGGSRRRRRGKGKGSRHRHHKKSCMSSWFPKLF